jgi:hypothetical protein
MTPHRTIYVIDRRPRYDLSYAVSAANTAPNEAEAILKAREWATKSGQTYYVHKLAATDTTWQPVAMVTP